MDHLGTGKTTLLQSIVANSYVQAALERKMPPIIVATSTNNQAVTNIIESFGKIQSVGFQNIEKRWIKGINSFATYFPSTSKIKEAIKKGYQFTNNKGEVFVEKIDGMVEESIPYFLKECREYFNKEIDELEQCEYLLHERLEQIEHIKNKILILQDEWEKLVGEEISIENCKVKKKSLIQLKKESMSNLEKRLNEWEIYYKKINPFCRALKFISYFEQKIGNKLNFYSNENEDFITNNTCYEDIQRYYQNEREIIRQYIIEQNRALEKVEKIEEYLNEVIEKLKDIGIFVNSEIIKNKRSLEQFLDTKIRYLAFWIAVHYYECRWLEKECFPSDKQRGKNFANVMENFYHRLSMITPCLVMTFYMLPKQFRVYQNENNYLYNFIDTLIVDEAGQVSTEIGVASFSLAKKAVVVGDIYQIEPVWSVEKALDESLAIQENLIKNRKEFEKLIELGVTTSNCSIMKIASKTTKYQKYKEKGLFLKEHRRCFDDIIKYCNELVYNKNLEPKRGNIMKNNQNEIVEPILPKMGYKQISVSRSERKGTSRYNKEEAKQIALWIRDNYTKIKNFYGKEDIIGVVTPFKAQVMQLKYQMRIILPKHIRDNITVGTVHTFQGAERKIIIFSSTYGKDDGCFFIDANPSLMNVAVSRAEDSFLIFGDQECLKYSEETASGLLRKYTKEHEVII